MDSGEINKILGGVIGALLLFLLLGFFGELIYVGPGGHEEEDRVLAFAVEVEEAEGQAEEEEEVVDFAALLAAADPSAGERDFNKCGACHSLEPGQNGVGPSLWNVVGRDIAGLEGFNYSQALLDIDGAWDLENLFGFIHDPSDWAPGTKMTFAGLPDNQDKVDVIAFLNQQSDDPTPLVAPEPVVTQLDEEEVAPGVEVGTEAEVPVVEEPPVESLDSPVQEAPLPREEEDEARVDAAQEEIADEEDIDNTATFSEQVTVPEDVSGTESEAPAPDEAEAEGGVEPGSVVEAPGTEQARPEAQPGSEAPADPEEVVDEEVETEAEVEANTTSGSTIVTEEDRTEPLPETAQPLEEAVEAQPSDEEPQTEQAQIQGGEQTQAQGGEQAQTQGQGGAEEGSEFAQMLADADVDAGEQAFRKCRACHRLEEGQNAVGPHLFGVVGRDIASAEGYNYSDALAQKEGAWEPAKLDEFLTDPQGWAPGTKMAFAGLRDAEERLNLIAYLQAAAE